MLTSAETKNVKALARLILKTVKSMTGTHLLFSYYAVESVSECARL
jgi:hypothetical protein